MPFSWYGPLPDACTFQSVNVQPLVVLQVRAKETQTHLHGTRDVDVCPPDGRLVGALRRLDALDEGLEEQRGGAAPGALAARLLSYRRQRAVLVHKQDDGGRREGGRTLQRSALDE